MICPDMAALPSELDEIEYEVAKSNWPTDLLVVSRKEARLRTFTLFNSK
jgi:hypothetical protein